MTNQRCETVCRDGRHLYTLDWDNAVIENSINFSEPSTTNKKTETGTAIVGKILQLIIPRVYDNQSISYESGIDD
jgi:hypothetical protein